MQRQRLDVILTTKGIVHSREKAQSLIMQGKVFVDGKRIEKAGTRFRGNENISIEEGENFVSRGWLKLKFAIEHFKIDVRDKICLDVGASTGGFTQCLLDYGANRVYAVDVGKGIIDSRLRNSPDVVLMEGVNFRYFEKNTINEKPDLITVDVSFISLSRLLDKIYETLKDGGRALLLVKPQFEVGRMFVKKGGIVKDENARMQSVNKISERAKMVGFDIIGSIECPVRGKKKGNKNYCRIYQKNWRPGKIG